MILIIGGDGYVGSYLAEHLDDVVVMDLKRGDDLLDKELLELYLMKADVVILLAAIVGDPACAEKPTLASKTNVGGVIRLVKSMKKNEVKRLIFASTCSVYGFRKKTCKEYDRLRPLSLYAMTKVLGEMILQDETDENFWPVILRLGTVYGKSPAMRCDTVVNKIIKEATEKGEFTIYSGCQSRPFLHLHDLLTVIKQVIDYDLFEDVAGEEFNIVSENLTIKQLGEGIAEITGAKMSLTEDKEDDRSYTASVDKAWKLLTWSPIMEIKRGGVEIEHRDAGIRVEQ